MTQVPLAYSPWTGEGLPSEPERFAFHYPPSPTYPRWFFNPWTGIRRSEAETETDPHGLNLAPPTPTCAPETSLRFQPSTGLPMQYLTSADAHRNRFPYASWFYNPWTGIRRSESEIDDDPKGLKLEPPSHDPGTASPPTPVKTEAGTATQEPRPMDWNPNVPPAPSPTPTPASTSTPNTQPQPHPHTAAPAMNAVLSSLGAAAAEVNALTRTATELAAKCRALQEENDRLRGLFRQIAVNADQSRFGRAVSLLTEEALNPKPGTGPHMRAAAGEGDEA